MIDLQICPGNRSEEITPQRRSASSEVRTTFRKWFYELMSGGERDSLKNAVLYSIDEVSAGRRFSASVPVLLKGSSLKPSSPAIELHQWRSDQEQGDRGATVEAISEYVEHLKQPVRGDDKVAHGVLRDMAREFLANFIRKDDSLSVDRFFNEIRNAAVGNT